MSGKIAHDEILRETESCLFYKFSTQDRIAVYINVHKNESYKSAQANLCEWDKRSKHCLEFIEDACLAFFSVFAK